MINLQYSPRNHGDWEYSGDFPIDGYGTHHRKEAYCYWYQDDQCKKYMLLYHLKTIDSRR